MTSGGNNFSNIPKFQNILVAVQTHVIVQFIKTVQCSIVSIHKSTAGLIGRTKQRLKRQRLLDFWLLLLLLQMYWL